MRTYGKIFTAVAALALAAGCGTGGGGGGGAGGGERFDERVTLIAGAAPGSGFDQTARAMQETIQKEKLARGAEVLNVPGASGTIALAQMPGKKGQADQLMATGLATISGVVTNGSKVGMEAVTPIAKLIGEADVIVVPADSPIKTFKDLVEEFKKDPKGVPIAAGSVGSGDHLFLGLLAKEVGVDPKQINYVAHSGGGEAVAAILGGKVKAGASGIGEFAEHIKSGKMRPLAVTSPQQDPMLPGVKTVKEQGYDVEFTNWRCVVAPAGLKPEDKKKVIDMITAMHGTQEWKNQLKEKGWSDEFMAGDEFAKWFATEEQNIRKTLDELGLAAS
ncbi:MAG: PhnD/SsuA/transferrin family substrate-binding protein [Streptosporangiales bacterium]|nr:PhnD/SsuA/transferrin family substrate-binding protein [Streptosporangiales bacterium]